MNIDEIEAEVLKLDPPVRAQLARKLLESLETLSDAENERLWAEEADRRDADGDSRPASARSAADVLQDARALEPNPPGSDPAPAAILLPATGGVKGRMSGARADDCPGGSGRRSRRTLSGP